MELDADFSPAAVEAEHFGFGDVKEESFEGLVVDTKDETKHPAQDLLQDTTSVVVNEQFEGFT